MQIHDIYGFLVSFGILAFIHGVVGWTGKRNGKIYKDYVEAKKLNLPLDAEMKWVLLNYYETIVGVVGFFIGIFNNYFIKNF